MSNHPWKKSVSLPPFLSLTPHSFRTASRRLASLRGPQATDGQARLARLFAARGMAQDVRIEGAMQAACVVSALNRARARRILRTGSGFSSTMVLLPQQVVRACAKKQAQTWPFTGEARDLASVFVAMAARSTADMADTLDCGQNGGLVVSDGFFLVFFFF
ncbi:hypothetical protein LZ31DRAFT_14722 [Colletotrichum somersetense]|nr:hypothetical protein LZ31DRAFT_14722 [Colletotrichum somersetense]